MDRYRVKRRDVRPFTKPIDRSNLHRMREGYNEAEPSALLSRALCLIICLYAFILIDEVSLSIDLDPRLGLLPL